MDLDEATKKRLEFLNDNYVPCEIHHLTGDHKVYLGDKENRKCRFCGKPDGEVAFKKIAHAIPEFTGNKSLIAHYECDDCNAKYSGLLESHMANYMNLWHTLSQVKGKKGVPSFKTIHEKKSRVDIGTTNIEVENHEGDNLATIDEDKKTITFTAKRASYIPIAIYKCLTKMALTIMPESELPNFKNTMDWINEPDHAASRHDLKSLFALMSIAPGAKPYPFTSCALFRRREDSKIAVPYMLFLLAYGNFAFQIYLPLCIEDKIHMGKSWEIIFIPTPVDMLEGSKILARKQLDLNGKVLIKGEEETIILNYQNLEEKPVSKDNSDSNSVQ